MIPLVEITFVKLYNLFGAQLEIPKSPRKYSLVVLTIILSVYHSEHHHCLTFLTHSEAEPEQESFYSCTES